MDWKELSYIFGVGRCFALFGFCDGPVSVGCVTFGGYHGGRHVVCFGLTVLAGVVVCVWSCLGEWWCGSRAWGCPGPLWRVWF